MPAGNFSCSRESEEDRGGILALVKVSITANFALQFVPLKFGCTTWSNWHNLFPYVPITPTLAQRSGVPLSIDCGSTGNQDRGMSRRGRSLPWRLRGVDFRPLLRPWDYEIRDQRPQIRRFCSVCEGVFGLSYGRGTMKFVISDPKILYISKWRRSGMNFFYFFYFFQFFCIYPKTNPGGP